MTESDDRTEHKTGLGLWKNTTAVVTPSECSITRGNCPTWYQTERPVLVTVSGCVYGYRYPLYLERGSCIQNNPAQDTVSVCAIGTFLLEIIMAISAASWNYSSTNDRLPSNNRGRFRVGGVSHVTRKKVYWAACISKGHAPSCGVHTDYTESNVDG